jgi:branched-chain amino acid transport system permease protein
MPVIETSRLRMAYRLHGEEDGLPMLCLHGSFGSSRWWQPFFDILPHAIRAIAPDLRGCGESDRSELGYDIPQQAEDVAALVEALGLDDFNLVGHASGAAIAVEYALAHSEKLRSLILVDPAPVEGVFTPLEGLRLLDQMRTDRDLLSRALASLMPNTPPPTMSQSEFDTFFAHLVADAQAMSPAAFTGVAQALDRWNRFDEAGRLTLPALLIWGSEDGIVDRDAVTRTLIAIPGAANLEVLRGIGHSPMIESPVLLAERIIDFLTDDFEEFEGIRDWGLGTGD